MDMRYEGTGLRHLGIVATAIAGLLAGVVQAQDRETPLGYAVSTSGGIARTGDGGCVHTSEWTEELARIVGCDGATLEPGARLIRGTGSGVEAEIVIPSASLFSFDSAELSPEGKAAIDARRAELAPELAAAEAIIIVGHTDSTGDSEYNQQLSLRRAEAVRDYLVETGLPDDNIRVVGRGDSDPIASNDTEEGRAENRRVEAIVVGELRNLDAMLFPSAALFPRRSAELTDEGRAAIEQQRAIAQEELARAVYIEVVGHTDDVGDDAYNQDLSEQRAATVANYLIDTGTEPEKILAISWNALFKVNRKELVKERIKLFYFRFKPEI
jgi:OOP family OmpA-OmpF porin